MGSICLHIAQEIVDNESVIKTATKPPVRVFAYVHVLIQW